MTKILVFSSEIMTIEWQCQLTNSKIKAKYFPEVEIHHFRILQKNKHDCTEYYSDEIY